MRKRINAASAEMTKTRQELRRRKIDYDYVNDRRYLGKKLGLNEEPDPWPVIESVLRNLKHTTNYVNEMQRRAGPGRATIRLATSPRAAIRLAKRNIKRRLGKKDLGK